MTPKEKAKELVATFNFLHDTENKAYIIYQTPNESKRCAFIAVDELIEQCHSYREIDLGMSLDYWEEVKQEIEKL